MEPDVNQQILAELRNLQRVMKRGLITLVVLFAIFVVAAIWTPRREGAYADVNTAIRALDYHRGVQLAEKIAADHPQDYSLQNYLGNVYLRSGDLANAEEAYSRSYALYPSEETGKILTAIRKARSGQNVSPDAQPTPQP